MSLQYYDSDNEALIPIAGNVNPSDVIELKASKADKTQISNRNLLDNPWFTVNQRGKNQYTTVGYCVDRWKLHDSNPFTLDVITSSGSSAIPIGITLTHPNNTTRSYFDQFCATDLRDTFATLAGKTVTLSVMKTDGTIYSASGVIPTFTSTNQTVCHVEVGDFRFDLNVRTTLMAIIGYCLVANATISIKAIKLELGSVSTLHLDSAPNYAEELLKCQRYFVRLYAKGGAYTPIGFGVAVSATRARIMTPLPVEMRILPGISSSGSFALFDGNSSISVTIDGDSGGINLYSLGATGSGLTQGKMYQLRMENDSTAVIDLSADL